MYRARLKNRRVKRKKKKESREWIIVLSIFFLIIMGVEFYEFIDRGSPMKSLGIKCSRINPEEIQNSLRLNPGANLFKIGLKEMRSKLINDSRIKDVHIFKNIFEGKIEVEIKERTPFAKVLRSGTDKCLEVDSDGIIIGETDNKAIDVPLITGLNIDYSSARPEINGTGILKQVTDLMKKGVSLNIPLEEISEVNVGDPGDIVFFTTYGTEFHLGKENLDERLKRVSTILLEIRKKRIFVRYVDLRFGEEAITKM